MSAVDGIIEGLDNNLFDFVTEELKPQLEVKKTIEAYLARINKAVELYRKTGVVPDNSIFENYTDVSNNNEENDENQRENKEGNAKERNSNKENIEPEAREGTLIKERSERPRRNAFKEATQNINVQANIPLNTKLRRTKNMVTNQNVYVKVEKLSLPATDSRLSYEASESENIKIKTEVDEMPAHARPAPRKKKRKGESKLQVKQEKKELDIRQSDVIIEEVTVPTINLLESGDEGEKTLINETPDKRNTRTKTKKKKKRSRTSSEEESKKVAEKRSKSNNKYEDAVSTLDANDEIVNATFVTTPAVNNNQEPQHNMNATVVIKNPKYVTNSVPVPLNVNDLMTDDESDEEVERKKPISKPLKTIPRPVKQVFSPFEQSPVKKKVQAFEKLKEDANTLPPRTTRTKTRAQAKQQEAEDLEQADNEPKSNVKEKARIFTPVAAKVFTPVTTKFLPKAASTSMKPSRVAPSSSNESLMSTKNASALKASQTEYREREKRRREKDQEAIKKREALIQAQIEEKKRKREEKQIKAQQQREALEKEKLKALEVQKLKDERHKQLLAEQEEKKLKQKEELEKKRMMAKIKAMEEKKRDEERRIEEQKKADDLAAKLAKQDQEIARMLQRQKEKQLPMYMKMRAPLLPTEDCYDSDDEHCTNKEIKLPSWGKEYNLRFMQKCAFEAGEAVKNTFFMIQAQTPDLQDIFEVIEPKKLKRSSSAVWHKPPRFTMIPGLENHDETEEFDDYE